MELTGILAKARNFVSFIMSIAIFISAIFGIVNPPMPSFTPEDTVEEVDNSPKMTLIDAGQSGYVIVKGADAAKSENTAAIKLQAYLKQISGVELPIVTDETAPQAPFVWIQSNQKLFEDIQALGLTQYDPGNDYVTLEEFNKLDLRYLYPKYWTWRQHGRDRQDTADNLGDIIWGWITDIEL